MSNHYRLHIIGMIPDNLDLTLTSDQVEGAAFRGRVSLKSEARNADHPRDVNAAIVE